MKRIITAYPYTASIKNRRMRYLVTGLSMYLDLEVTSIYPSVGFQNYRNLKNLGLIFHLITEILLSRREKRIYYFISRPQMSAIAYRIRKIKEFFKDRAIVIFDYYEEHLSQHEVFGKLETFEKRYDVRERYIRSVEYILREADISLFVNPLWVRNLEQKGIYIKNPVVIPNAGDPCVFKAYPLPEKPVIGHISVIPDRNIGLVRGLEILIEAFSIVRTQIPNAELHLMGPINKDYLTYLKRTYGDLQGIRFTPQWIPFHRLPDYFKDILVFVNVLKPTRRAYELGGSSYKLFDYMAAGRPTVATDIPGFQILKEENCGILCKFDPEDLSEKLILLLNDRQLSEKLGNNGRKAIENKHSWDHRVSDLVDALHNIYPDL